MYKGGAWRSLKNAKVWKSGAWRNFYAVWGSSDWNRISSDYTFTLRLKESRLLMIKNYPFTSMYARIKVGFSGDFIVEKTFRIALYGNSVVADAVSFGVAETEEWSVTVPQTAGILEFVEFRFMSLTGGELLYTAISNGVFEMGAPRGISGNTIVGAPTLGVHQVFTEYNITASEIAANGELRFYDFYGVVQV